MSRGLKAQGAPMPRRTWRTKLINWFMLRAPWSRHSYATTSWVVHGDGCVEMYSCLPDGEIISSMAFGSHVFDQFVSNLLEVQASKKLVE